MNAFMPFILMVHCVTYYSTCFYYLIKDSKKSNFAVIEETWLDALKSSLENTYVTSLIYLTHAVLSLIFNIQEHRVSQIRSIINIPFYILFIDIYFYTFHRIFHHFPALYKIHKEHHVPTSIVSAHGLACHPIEHVVLNLGSILVPYILLGFSRVFFTIYVAYVSYSAAASHSGYNPSIKHNIHHTFIKFNYGTGIYFMDYLFGTFRRIKIE